MTDEEVRLEEPRSRRRHRYFDVFVEYAKASVEEIGVRVTVMNRGMDAATLDLLPAISSITATGFPEIAEWFETLTKAEKNHAARYTQGLNSIRS